MSGAGNTKQNLTSTQPRMKDGEEPTELLLALVSSPLIALKGRGIVRLMTANTETGPVLLAVFENATFDESVGITLLPTVANAPAEAE